MLFEEAIVNKDYIKISHKAAAKYKKLLDSDELEQCRNIGIWKACKNYKESKSKLSTYIYNNILWECGKVYKKNTRHKYKSLNSNNLCVKRNILKEVCYSLAQDEYALFYDRFIYRTTYTDLATKYSSSPQEIKCRITNLLNKLRQILSGS